MTNDQRRLEALQNVGDQGAGEVMRQATKRRRIFFEKAVEVSRLHTARETGTTDFGTELFPACQSGYFHADHDQHAGGMTGSCVVSERRRRGGEHGAA